MDELNFDAEPHLAGFIFGMMVHHHLSKEAESHDVGAMINVIKDIANGDLTLLGGPEEAGQGPRQFHLSFAGFRELERSVATQILRRLESSFDSNDEGKM